jgi:putative redox protein
MAVDIDIVYEGDLRCRATHRPSGNQLATDAPLDNGGQGAAFSPTDLVATALGTCLMTIMGIVARQRNIDLRGTKVHVVKEMAPKPIRRIASLRVEIRIPNGTSIRPEDRTRLENGARTCPVHQSLHADVAMPIEFIYEP